MNRTEYQRTLFETAMLVMVCDGDINDREIDEMRAAFDNSILFQDLTFEEELARLLEELGRDKQKVVLDYFSKIEKYQKAMGSLSIFKEGKEVYQRSFGFSDVSKNLRAGTNTKYRIGSISKTFTACHGF